VLRLHAEYAAAYLDKVIIYGDTWPQHLRWVAAVLESLRQAGLTANLKKGVSGWREYLGYHLARGWVRPLLNKTDAVAACPRPEPNSR